MKSDEVAYVYGGDASDLMKELTGKTKFIIIENYEMLINLVLSTDTPEPRTIVWENADEYLLENPSTHLIRMMQYSRKNNTGCIFTFKNRIYVNPIARHAIDHHILKDNAAPLPDGDSDH